MRPDITFGTRVEKINAMGYLIRGTVTFRTRTGRTCRVRWDRTQTSFVCDLADLTVLPS